MSGVVEIVLTDKEIDILLDWANFVAYESGGFIPGDGQLYRKLEGYKHALACRPTLCAPRDLDPNAP